MAATIRQATREDVPTIHQLVMELAEYEHAAHEVQATHESLGSTLAFAASPEVSIHNTTPSDGDRISPSRPAKCLLLFNPAGEPAGMALYFYNYSTWRSSAGIYLEDLFVREKERGKGYGKRLLVELAKEVVGMKGGRLEWSVLKWNKPSIEFYERMGAKAMDECVGMRVDGNALKRMASMEV